MADADRPDQPGPGTPAGVPDAEATRRWSADELRAAAGGEQESTEPSSAEPDQAPVAANDPANNPPPIVAITPASPAAPVRVTPAGPTVPVSPAGAVPPGDVNAATTVLPPAKDPVRSGPAATSVMPPISDPPAPGTPKWAARAEVPAVTPQLSTPTDEWQALHPPRRSVIMPIMITVAIIILVGLISLGVWAVVRGAEKPTPLPTRGPVTSAAPAPTSAAPTSAAPPTSEAPPSPEGPELIPVPPVKLLPAGVAKQALSALGLTVAVVEQADAGVPAGLAIGTDPGAGSLLALHAPVTLFVSTGAPAEEPTDAPATEPAAPTSPPAG